MKNQWKRNELKDKHNIIGLKIKAAKIINNIAVSVIQGVCDYADDRKNKD